jgi:hypothetical protein
VTAENVLEYLHNAEEAGLIELTSAMGGSR